VLQHSNSRTAAARPHSHKQVISTDKTLEKKSHFNQQKALTQSAHQVNIELASRCKKGIPLIEKGCKNEIYAFFSLLGHLSHLKKTYTNTPQSNLA
jgi:hypothetical protein